MDHPMKEAVIASQSTQWQTVAAGLSVQDCEAQVYYQKHMTHHMLPGVDLGWTRHLRHCFLVRNPFEVVNSYARKRDTVTVEDIGVTRQLALYKEISEISGQQIPVLDAAEFLVDPKAALSALCDFYGITFYEEMLNWPAGRRETDGVWAPHWYEAVEKSTGFEPYQARALKLSTEQREVAAISEDAYRMLCDKGHRL